jgi:hypothetical protein
MKFDIRDDDDIYLDLKKWYNIDKYEEFKNSLVYDGINLGVFANNVNAINKNHGGDLDVSLLNDTTLRLYDRKLKETVADYEIIFDLYNSVIDYLFEEIK